MLRLYNNVESGNCYKIRLLLSHLDIPFENIDVSVLGDRDAARKDTVFQKNPIGKIPTIELEDGTTIGESTAILWYLADGTPYLPDDKLARVRVLQWLAFEQNNHEPNIATARHQIAHNPDKNPTESQIAEWKSGGERALRIMESRLAEHEFFGDRYGIADIALYAYTHVAEEGPFALEPYPAIRRWFDRVRAQPGHVPMEA